MLNPFCFETQSGGAMRIRVSGETQVGRIGEGAVAIAQHDLECGSGIIVVNHHQIRDAVLVKVRGAEVCDCTSHS